MSELPDNISEETIIRLRAKMEDLSYRRFEEKGSAHVAFRVPGEKIDLLNALEYLSEFLTEDDMTGLDHIVIISDREVEVTNGSIMEKKVMVRKADDERLYSELRSKIPPGSDPLIFTMENDILELYRVAIRTRGTVKDEERVITPEVQRVLIPKEGEIFYIVYDDGYRKLGRPTFEKRIDEARSKGQTQAQVAKEPRTDESSRTSFGQDAKKGPQRTVSLRGDHIRNTGEKPFVRDITKSLSSLGYREDTRFSRPDMDQIFLVGMNGPSILLKVSIDCSEVSSFLRVLEHRKDVLGVLVSDVWTPAMEAMSRSHGFIYLTGERVRHVLPVLHEVLRGGGV